jgi:MATE family multidrug resistance protein
MNTAINRHDIEDDGPIHEESLISKNDALVEDEENQTFIQMFWYVTKLTVPIIISMIFFTAVIMLSTFYIGHTDDPVLIAGCGMGNMLMNVLALAELMGINMAIETLVSRTFGASQDPTISAERKFVLRKECGIIFNKAKIIASFLCVPIAIFFYFSDVILIKLDQDPEVARIARNFLVMMIPGVWA